ncbi:hypothetical protein PHLGIDRAFT_129270 [Phlebiopsis gigantea 11061_1 CR5-6]|uniref:BAH domain-containing protein n=1 Tax=Phlebiopsis gigantea (strain 11061_1 CR5-6) TaxID=745531 RepID=A0A0C3S466_PHLG1|nr:hypothetical protein PHLGIDRAFT_129270 [Phlebiopsis gigantea 11061_1 CR5-6]
MGRARKKPSRRSPNKGRRVTSKISSMKLAFTPADDVDPTDKPTDSQWKRMDQAEELVTTKYRYKKGCDVLVNSSDGPKNAWIGRVWSIRRRQFSDRGDFWLRVQWYYSPSDIGGVNDLKLNEVLLESFPDNERVLSDAYDLISATTLDGTTHVYRYDEEAVDPPEINFTQHYFVRCDLKDTLSTSPMILPFPGQHTCICRLPYNPFPEEVELARAATESFYKRSYKSSRSCPNEVERTGDYMHFCPRPACSTWFHESCLLEPVNEANFIATPDVRRLAVDPDLNHPCTQLARYAYEKPPRGKGSHGAPSTLRDVLGAFPFFARPDCPLRDALLSIAGMPIVRRAGDGVFSTAGNVADVVLARRLVYQALDGWHNELERVIERLDKSWYDGEGKEDAYNFVWRFLNSQRILASPRVKYWDELTKKLEVHEGRPVLHCPRCLEDNFLVSI